MELPSFDQILRWGRRVNLNALRIISLTCFFLSLTPLSSLYILLTNSFTSTSPFGETSEATTTTTTPTTASTTKLLTTLQNPNATLEEILTAVLLERAHAFGGIGAHGAGIPSLAHHWATVIPWALSMFFGLVVPVTLYSMSLIRSWRLRQEREADLSAYRKRRRKEKIQAALSNYVISLKQEDRDMDIPEDTNAGGYFWKIPHPGCTATSKNILNVFYGKQQRDHPLSSSSLSSSSSDTTKNNNNMDQDCGGSRSIPGLCAICLNNYQKGDKVAWSSNPVCLHAFHLNCLLDWYSVRRRKQYLCPCCRQMFFDKHRRSNST